MSAGRYAFFGFWKSLLALYRIMVRVQYVSAIHLAPLEQILELRTFIKDQTDMITLAVMGFEPTVVWTQT